MTGVQTCALPILNKKNFVIKINNNIFCDLDNDFIFKLVLYHELFHALVILSGDFNENINLYINNFLFEQLINQISYTKKLIKKSSALGKAELVNRDVKTSNTQENVIKA